MKDVDAVLAQIGVKADDIKNDAVRPSIIENFNFARELNISGTPSFIVGDKLLGGFVTKDKLAEAIDSQIKKK